MSPILSRLSWAQGFGRRPYSAPPGSAIFNNIEDFFSTYLYYGATATVSHIQKASAGGGIPTTSTDSPFTGEGEGYNSVEFGLDKCIEITTSSEFNFGSNESFTVEWWEKRFPLNSSTPIEKDPYMTVMDIGNTSAGLYIGLDGTNQGKYQVKIGNGGTTIIDEGTGVAADSGWHHYAFTVESLGGNQQKGRFYRDGVEQAHNTVTSITWGSSSSDWTVGGQKAYPSSYNFQGRVSNFRVTKGICRYKANFSIPTKPFSDWADGANTYTLFVCCKSADVLGADGAVFTNGAYTKKTRVKYLEKGGMVWIKSRGQAQQNTIVDTIRGRDKHIFPDANNSEATDNNNISAFTGDGFSVGNDSRVNNSSYHYTSWSFARDPKFMDIVEYTGNGATSRYINHALDNIPGFLMIKNLDQGNAGWVAIHRNAQTETASPDQGVCQLNSNHTTIWNLGDTPDAQYPSLGGPDNKTNQFHVTSNWNNYETSSNTGYLGTNNNGERYIAYVFAHDESANGMIRCGYFNTDDSGISPVNGNNQTYNDLGWEPQWILTKEVCQSTGSTKLLFLQSSTDPLAFTATPGTISYTGSAMSASSDSPFASSGSVTFTGNQSNNIKIQGPANGGGTDLQFGTGAFTVECWIKTTAQAGWIMNNCYNGNGISIAVSQDATQGSGYVGRVEFCEKVNGSINGHTFSGSTVNDGQWHHIAMSRTANGASTSCFVDGVSVGSHGGTTNHNGTEDCFFGRNKGSAGTAFVGQISNFRITNTHLYGGNFTPSTTPLTETGGYAGTTGDWLIWDDKRGVGKFARYLLANDNQHESGTANYEMTFKARGFRCTHQSNGRRFIYVAIRKGLLGNPKDTKRKAVDLFALAKGASSSSTYQGNNGGFVTNIVDSGSVEPPVGQTQYTTPGNYTWTVPANVTTIHIGMVGGGAGGGGGGGGGYRAVGGAGGGGAYANNVSVTPGETLHIDVGSGGSGGSGSQHPTAPGGNGTDSKVHNLTGSTLCHASGAVWQNNNQCDAGRMIVGDGGGLGGGDYATTGGAGGNGNQMADLDGNGNFAGACGGYGTGGGGGGVAFSGDGAYQTSTTSFSNNGRGTYDILSNSQVGTPDGGSGRNGGTNGASGTGGYGNIVGGAGNGGDGGTYGGGGGGAQYGGIGGQGGGGAVRIIWGDGRSFPNNHGDQPTNTGTSTEVKTYGFAPDAGFVLQSYDASGGARECWARVGGTSNTGGPGGSSAYQTKWDLDGNQSQTDTQNSKWPMNGGNYGGNNLGNNDIIWTWRRAKGFFDSCYFGSTGNDNQPYPHNLGVVPEMIWQRRVSGSQTGMYVYHKDLPVTQYLETSTQYVATSSGLWGDGTVPHTSTHFTMGSVASSGNDNVAFLFATNPGISKVGKYDTLANGDPQNIDCGFTNGARAVLIKKITNTSSSDGWFCFDTARGMADATSGASSGSVTFTGNVTDTLKVDDQGGFRFGNGPYTIEFWIKTTANAGWIMHNAQNNNGWRICIGNNGGGGSNSGKIEINEQVANADEYTHSTTSVNDGQWHHVAFSRPDGGQVKVFIDGQHEATGNSSGRQMLSNDDCYFGRRHSGGGWALNGQLSNFRITNETLYTSGFTPPTSPLAQTSDTKMLFMQSTTDPLASTVTPGTISYTGGTMSASGDNPFSNAVTPYMRLDDTQPQTTGNNPWIKVTDTGFRIESGNNINAANETYIYYAIA